MVKNWFSYRERLEVRPMGGVKELKFRKMIKVGCKMAFPSLNMFSLLAGSRIVRNDSPLYGHNIVFHYRKESGILRGGGLFQDYLPCTLST
jgi:hypothetical protein